MRSWRRLRAAAPGLLAALGAGALAACSSGASVALPQPAATPAAVGPLVAGSAPIDLGPTDPHRSVSVTLVLRDDLARQRSAAVAGVSQPGSPTYGDYLSPAQLAAYGPDPKVVARVRAALARHGLAARWSPGDAWLGVTGPAGSAEAAFSVALRDSSPPGGPGARGRYYRAVDAPRVPGWLGGDVTAVERLTDRPLARPLLPGASLRQAVPSGGLTPAGVVAAYGAGPLRSAGIDGSGQTVVLYAIDGFSQSDLDAYASRFGLPPFVVHDHLVPAGGRAPQPQGEATLDLEVVHAIAPGARLEVYTLGGQAGADYLQLFRQGFTDNPRSVATASFGGCERDLGTSGTAFDSVLAGAGAVGTTLLAASGDSGGFDCYGQDWTAPPTQDQVGTVFPASLPSVTGVGGTRLAVGSQGAFAGEFPWYEPARLTGSGGGVSTVFRRPTWQSGPGLTPGTGPDGGPARREVPDVSADADPASGLSVVIGGQAQQGGGTSQASPVWAGLLTLVNAFLERGGAPHVGFANPALYALAKAHPEAFHDVTVGGNGVFRAGAGYDPVTGLGTPDADAIARDLLALHRGGTT